MGRYKKQIERECENELCYKIISRSPSLFQGKHVFCCAQCQIAWQKLTWARAKNILEGTTIDHIEPLPTFQSFGRRYK